MRFWFSSQPLRFIMLDQRNPSRRKGLGERLCSQSRQNTRTVQPGAWSRRMIGLRLCKRLFRKET